MDEFDEGVDPPTRLIGVAIAGRGGDRRLATAPRLLARLYRSADASLRASILSCLLRPLGTLGLAAVSAGAFAAFIGRGHARNVSESLDDLAAFTSTQVLELARFVEQVSPEALQRAATLLTENPVGMAAFGASAALLLLRTVRVRVTDESGAADRDG